MKSQGKVMEKLGNFEMENEWQPWNKYGMLSEKERVR